MTPVLIGIIKKIQVSHFENSTIFSDPFKLKPGEYSTLCSVFCFLFSPPLSPPKNHNVEVGFYNFAVYEYAELEPEVSKHLSDLLEYDGDVQKDFGLDFSVCMKESDGPKTYMLKKNGHKVKVSRENRREYVSRYIEFMMNQYISAAFIAFYKGFHSVCDSKVLTLLKAEELQSIICGEPHLGL